MSGAGGDDASRRIYRDIAENSPDIVVCYDLDLRRVYLNRAYREWYGGADSMADKTLMDASALPAGTTAILCAVLRAAIESGQPQNTRFEFPDDGGTAVPYHMHAVPRRDAGGRTVGAIGYFRDISEYNRMEAELTARAAEFRALAENSPDAVARYDRQLRRIYVNPAYASLGSRPAAPTTGKAALPSYLPEAEASIFRERIVAVMDTGTPENLEVDFLRHDGKRVVQHVAIVPEFAADGSVAGALTLARDVSDLKEVLGRLEQTEAMARLGYWQWDFATAHATVSPEVCRMFGQARGWSPDPAAIIEFVVPEEREWVAMTVNVVLASQSPDVSLDYRVCIGGEVLDLHSTIRIDYDANGNPSRLVGTAQDVSQIKRYENRVYTLAHYDVLTGLPNRDLFGEHLRQAIAEAAGRNHEVAVLILNLDHFKAVNETFGHNGGDHILRDAAARLRRCIRDYDTVARFGGDEFAFIMADLPHHADLGKICRKMLDALAEPFMFDNTETFITGSIGIARYPTDGSDVACLVQYADAAMHHAKEEGRDNHQFYAASLTRSITQRLHLAARLRRAQANGELELYYQPQIDLANDRLVGAEALLRWNHPEAGLLTPDSFIGIAEETGLIVGIGAWVLRTACAAAVKWNQHRRTPVRVAVNLSPRQFKSADLVALVADTLAETGCQPSWLELEITEGMLVEDADGVRRTLDALRATGVSISIDDFGTGYSALSYLKRFHVDTIKIDRSFVRDVGLQNDSAELVKAIIAMAHSLHLSVIAEGVEDATQEQFLRAQHCQIGQGYLYARPLPLAGFGAWLAAQRPPSKRHDQDGAG